MNKRYNCIELLVQKAIVITSLWKILLTDKVYCMILQLHWQFMDKDTVLIKFIRKGNSIANNLLETVTAVIKIMEKATAFIKCWEKATWLINFMEKATVFIQILEKATVLQTFLETGTFSIQFRKVLLHWKC